MTARPRDPVIAGLGMTEIGRVYGRTAAQFAAEAVRLAAADAGLALGDIDGLLVSPGSTGGVHLGLQRDLDLHDLTLLTRMQAYGSTAAAMVQFASMAIQAEMASVVACAWADDPLRPGGSAAAAYGGRAARVPAGWPGLIGASGILGSNSMYALAARRHMQKYGTSHEDLGSIAIAQRDWAALNPLAQLREPVTMADYLSAPWIAEPFRLLDCCLVSNGGIAVIVTAADRAASLAQPPVHVLGWAQSHPGHFLRRDDDFGLVSGAAMAGPAALAMAGVALADIDLAELYDCYTYTVLITLEDYGFCAKGEGGPFVSSGVLGPGGTLKVNTGGSPPRPHRVTAPSQSGQALRQSLGPRYGQTEAPIHQVAESGPGERAGWPAGGGGGQVASGPRRGGTAGSEQTRSGAADGGPAGSVR